MDQALARSMSPIVPSFCDGLGERFLQVDKTSGEALEMLRLRAELTEVPSFEFALRERVGRLANFRHAYYGRVRRVDRVTDGADGLVVVYEHTPGARLSEILAVAERDDLGLDINAALFLIRQLVPAVAMLHQNARDVSHGALGPERIVVTPHARLVILEYVLGSALEQMHYSHDRLWKDFRVAVPASAGLPRFDHRADVTQIGIVALSLVLGRPLREDEYPRRIAEVLANATEISTMGKRQPMSAALRNWLGRALQIDYRQSFHSAIEAQSALEVLLTDESGYIAAPIALETFLARYHDRVSFRSEPPPASTPERGGAEVIGSVSLDLPDPPSYESELTPPAAAIAPPVAAVRDPYAFEAERLFVPEPPAAAAPARKVRPPATRSSGSRIRRVAIMVLSLMAIAEAGIIASRLISTSPEAPAPTGVLVVESRPSGAEVVVDGRVRGATPIRLSLPPGAHSMELTAPGGRPRVIPLSIQAGGESSQYIELESAAVDAGRLMIKTEPSGARVSIDGKPRGMSPLNLDDLTPGDHEVLLESDLGTVRQSVTVRPGATASLLVPLVTTGAPLSGWVAVSAPVEVQLFENGRLIGTSQSERIMVGAGGHEIEVVNETLGYRAKRNVQVPAGRVASLKIELPKGTMSLNAVPWAEVWIDGEKVGETPIGNLSIPIGAHEVVFRNPQLGEQHHAVTVTLNAPTRLSVDLRR